MVLYRCYEDRCSRKVRVFGSFIIRGFWFCSISFRFFDGFGWGMGVGF